MSMIESFEARLKEFQDEYQKLNTSIGSINAEIERLSSSKVQTLDTVKVLTGAIQAYSEAITKVKEDCSAEEVKTEVTV